MLLLALVALIGGVVWAVGTAFQGFSPPMESRDQSTDGPTTTSDAGSGQGGTGGEGTLTAPVIASGEALDPEGGATQGEHPEDAGKALDGLPTTAWVTRTYKNAQFGNLKSGVGFAIVLQDRASVSAITLTTGNTGGHVEVRATSPDRPTSGDVLAAGSLSPTTVLHLSQTVEAQSLVLWFTELPQAADGGYRVEIVEITVS